MSETYPGQGQPPRSGQGQPPQGGMGEDLRAAARDARAAASLAAETVTQEANAAARTLRQEGESVVEAVQARAESLGEEVKRDGAERIEGVARAIHRAAEELQGASPGIAGMVHDAAGAIDRVANGLRDASPGEMYRGVTEFAQRNPLAFFGGCMLAGFALARFARAAAPARRHAYDDDDDGMAPRAHHMSGSTAGMTGEDISGSSTTGGMSAPAAATGQPGWVREEDGTARPGTLASASLGGAAAMRPPGQQA